VEFVGNTSVTAKRIVIEDGAVLAGERPALGRLTLIAKGSPTSDIVSRGTIDIAANDDVSLQAAGTIDLGGPTAITAVDRIDLKTTQGSVLVTPPPAGPDVGFTLFARNRVTLSARGAEGILDVAAARIGAYRIVLDTRANVSVVGPKQLLVRDGSLLATDRERTGLLNGSYIQLTATGRIGVSDAVIDAGTQVSLATQRAGDDACLSNGAVVEASNGTGNLYFSAVRGTVHVDASTELVGRLLARAIDDGPCP
jgi:hypothetical protein